MVAKVGDKIFVFLGAETIGVKAGGSREEADAWIDRYPDEASVMPYIGRHGWNTLRVGGAIGDDEIAEAITASYERVVERLPKSKRPPARVPGAAHERPANTGPNRSGIQ